MTTHNADFFTSYVELRWEWATSQLYLFCYPNQFVNCRGLDAGL